MSETETAPAESTIVLRGRTGTGINWVGAFLLYAKGAKLDEVATELDIPFPKLKAKWREEDWDSLVKLNRIAIAPPVVTGTPVEIVVRDAAKRIEANREASISVSQGLRSHIQKILNAYEAGNVFLPPGDIKILAAAAKDLDQSSMIALGDDPAPKFQPPPVESQPKQTQDNRPVTHFHINLPGAAMAPRIPKRVHGETHHVLPAAPLVGVPKNPVLDPSPRRTGEISEGATLLRPVKVESEIVEGSNGRDSVDFTKLAKVSTPEPAKVAGGIPACFT